MIQVSICNIICEIIPLSDYLLVCYFWMIQRWTVWGFEHLIKGSYMLVTARELFRQFGFSQRLYQDVFDPLLQVGLYAPAEQCSAAATLGILYYIVLAHQVWWLELFSNFFIHKWLELFSIWDHAVLRVIFVWIYKFLCLDGYRKISILYGVVEQSETRFSSHGWTTWELMVVNF